MSSHYRGIEQTSMQGKHESMGHGTEIPAMGIAEGHCATVLGLSLDKVSTVSSTLTFLEGMVFCTKVIELHINS